MRGALVVVVLAGGCAGVWWGAELSQRADHIKAPHARHAKAGVACLTCHENVFDQKELGPGLLPPESKCLECHGEMKAKGQCAKCHTDVKHAENFAPPPSGIKMGHEAHLNRLEHVKDDAAKCKTCHWKLPEPLRGGTAPTMDACTACHVHKQDFDAGRCVRCHTDLARYPLEPISSFSHAGNFVREHGRSARASAESCATCHDQNFCKDCHANTAHPKIEIKLPERVERDFIHRNDFLGRHASEEAADPASCRRCHGTSFCEDCHRKNGLTTGALNPRNPHPPNWVLNLHGTAARQNINSCASCHDQGAQSNCVNCHKVGGIGGNPHPPGWNRSTTEIRTNNMCLICHQ
jgi:hypothetical protein